MVPSDEFQDSLASGGSISRWIQELKEGDEFAATRLWERYCHRITGLARKRLDGQLRAVAGDDVAQSVFRDLCQGAVDGAFPKLADRENLWHLLARLTNRKAIDQIRKERSQKRGGGKTRGESALHQSEQSEGAGFDALPTGELPPDLVIEMVEECQRLLDSLPDDVYRFVVYKRLEGYTNKQIAELMNVTTRAVERKLQNVRDYLRQQGEREGNGPSAKL